MKTIEISTASSTTTIIEQRFSNLLISVRLFNRVSKKWKRIKLKNSSLKSCTKTSIPLLGEGAVWLYGWNMYNLEFK